MIYDLWAILEAEVGIIWFSTYGFLMPGIGVIHYSTKTQFPLFRPQHTTLSTFPSIRLEKHRAFNTKTVQKVI